MIDDLPVKQNRIFRSASSSEAHDGDFSNIPNSPLQIKSVKQLANSRKAQKEETENQFSMINMYPQDYVITNGQAYRVVRSPRPPLQENSEESRIKLLLIALEDAEKKLAEKDIIISRQAQYIMDLESKLKYASSSTSELFQKSSRSREKIRSALQNDNSLISSPTTSITSLELNRNISNESTSNDLDPTSDLNKNSECSTPSTASVTSMRSDAESFMIKSSESPPLIVTKTLLPGNSSPKLSYSLKSRQAPRSRPVPVSAPVTQQARKAIPPDYEPSSPPFKPEMDENPSLQPSTNSSITAAQSMWLHAPPPPAGQRPVYLYIAHDNPQLNNSILESHINFCNNNSSISTSRLRSSSNGSNGSGDSVGQGNDINVMLETCDSEGYACIILGSIAYNGNIANLPSIMPVGTELKMGQDGDSKMESKRGSECLVVTNLSARRVKINLLESRINGEIIEIQLDSKALSKDCTVDITAESRLHDLLDRCRARVDVILSPHHRGLWFPYWEIDPEDAKVLASTSKPLRKRKLAPQFRSRGVGYLRLGDDMSQNGTSFLSCNGFVNYLDGGRGGLVEGPRGYESSSVGNGNDLSLNVENKVIAILKYLGMFCDSSANVKANPNEVTSSEHGENTKPNCTKMAEALNDMTTIFDDLVVKIDIIISSWMEHLDAATRVLTDYIIHQKNPLVLKSTLSTATSLLALMQKVNLRLIKTNGSKYYLLLLEVIHVTRHSNRVIGDSAVAVLNVFVSNQLTSLSLILLVIGDAISGSKRRGGVTNTARVIAWLKGIFHSVHKSVIDLYNTTERSTIGETIACEAVKDIQQIFVILQLLLSHKEEGVRENTVQALCELIMTEVYLQKVTSRNETNAAANPAKCSDAISCQDKNALLELMSDGRRESMKEIEKTVSSRMMQRILQCCVDGMCLSANSTRAGKGCESIAGDVSAGKGSVMRSRGGKHVTPNPPSDPAALSSALPPSLHEMWFEVSLVLKTPPPETHLAWIQFSTVVSGSSSFFEKLYDISAKREVTVGAQIRILLPFNENTSSNDQSDVMAEHFSDKAVFTNDLFALHLEAIALRKLIRVKMADEADVLQAKAVMSQMEEFRKEIERVSKERGVAPWQVMGKLSCK